jgi:hypothetical protein
VSKHTYQWFHHCQQLQMVRYDVRYRRGADLRAGVLSSSSSSPVLGLPSNSEAVSAVGVGAGISGAGAAA